MGLFFLYQVYALGWCNDDSEACQQIQATSQAYMWAAAVGGFLALAGFVFLMAYYLRTSPSR